MLAKYCQGTSGNLGMYMLGIPLGKLVDSKGARVGALLGALLNGIGYFGLYHGMAWKIRDHHSVLRRS